MKSSQAPTLTTPQTESQTASEYKELVLVNGADAEGNLLLLALKGGVPYQVAYQQRGGGWEVTGQQLPNKSRTTYKALVTGVDFKGALLVVGLGEDNNPYLVCSQDRTDNSDAAPHWNNDGRQLPNIASSRTFTALAMAVGDHGYLQVVGLDNEGTPYILCYLRNQEGWMGGAKLPNTPGKKYNQLSLLTRKNGDRQGLQVVGLDKDRTPWLVCWLDSGGHWQDGSPNPLPNRPNRKYKELVTGVDYRGSLKMVGLSDDGKPYLVCSQNPANDPDSTPEWNDNGGDLPNFASPPAFKALATGIGNMDFLQLMALGTNGQPYLPCYQRKGEGWREGGPIPNTSGKTYKQLSLLKRKSGGLQLVGLGEDNRPYLVCWQDSDLGTWHPAGMPLDVMPMGSLNLGTEMEPSKECHVKAGEGLELALKSDMREPVTLNVLGADGQPTRALFEGDFSSFEVLPKGPKYLVIKKDAPDGTYKILPAMPAGEQGRRLPPRGTVRCEIIVVKT